MPDLTPSPAKQHPLANLADGIIRSRFIRLYQFESTEQVPHFSHYQVFIKEFNAHGSLYTCDRSLMVKTDSEKVHLAWSLFTSIKLSGKRSIVVHMSNGEKSKFKFSSKLARKHFLWHHSEHLGKLLPIYSYRLVKFVVVNGSYGHGPIHVVRQQTPPNTEQSKQLRRFLDLSQQSSWFYSTRQCFYIPHSYFLVCSRNDYSFFFLLNVFSCFPLNCLLASICLKISTWTTHKNINDLYALTQSVGPTKCYQ